MDVDQFIQAVQQYILHPLDHLPTTQISFLETNHDQSVQDFQNAIGLLFPPGQAIFQGKAADAFANYIGSYLDAEEALSPYAGSGLSDRVNTLLNKCKALHSQEQGLIQSIQNDNGWGNAGKTLVEGETIAAPFEIGAPPDAAVALVIILGIVAIGLIGANISQQNQIRSLSDAFNQWATDMQTLAQQPDPQGSELPKLPAEIDRKSVV